MAYQIYALKYAERDTKQCTFFFREPSQDTLTLHFYLWVILGGPYPIVLDTGFSAADAQRREARKWVSPADMLSRVGVKAAEVPVALILSRQDVQVVTTPEQAEGLIQGGYVLAETDGVDGDPDELDVVLVGTGSEVAVCVEAATLLEADGLRVRVVSLPSWDLFELLDPESQEAVLPDGVPTLAVEAAVSFGWGRFADEVVSIERFGASAPGSVVLEKLGFTPANVAARARDLIDAMTDEDKDEERN